MERPLLTTGGDTFVRFNEAISILEKVHTKDFKSFADEVSSRKPFGLPTNVKVRPTQKDGDIRIFAYPNDGFIRKTDVERGTDIIDKSKVLISYVYGERGDFPYLVIGKPFIGEAGTCCSETYLVAHVCSSVAEANNVISYMTTRFFRFLVLTIKNTQHATAKVYSLVPVQDFSEPWTDEKLYAKYGINENEIAFIESMIRPMELGGGADE
jgi:site-specific DNA-methyltransferase (adenine-specific)